METLGQSHRAGKWWHRIWSQVQSDSRLSWLDTPAPNSPSPLPDPGRVHPYAAEPSQRCPAA